MNEKCKELGLKKTHFDNPVGSDIGAGYNETYASAKEMAKICRYAMAIPLIRRLVKAAIGVTVELFTILPGVITTNP